MQAVPRKSSLTGGITWFSLKHREEPERGRAGRRRKGEPSRGGRSGSRSASCLGSPRRPVAPRPGPEGRQSPRSGHGLAPWRRTGGGRGAPTRRGLAGDLRSRPGSRCRSGRSGTFLGVTVVANSGRRDRRPAGRVLTARFAPRAADSLAAAPAALLLLLGSLRAARTGPALPPAGALRAGGHGAGDRHGDRPHR